MNLFPFIISAFALLCSHLEAIKKVPFDIYPEGEIGHLLKSLYDSYNPQVSSEEYLIPKLIHFIWLGSPLPEECSKLIDTWRKYHPDWTIKIWTDREVYPFRMENRKAFQMARNYGEKSDIWRYEILYRYGGVYADIDFECLQSFDDIHKTCEFYTGFLDSTVLLNGLIGTKPGHPIMRACIDHLKVGPGDHNEERIMQYAGPYYFTRMFFAAAPMCTKGSIVAFPGTYFYPFPASLRDLKDVKRIKMEFVKEESMTLHYWTSTWQKNKK